jgi:hypothetical protein
MLVGQRLLMGWGRHHITSAAFPQFFQNPIALIQKNLRLQKRNSNIWNPPALLSIQNQHGPPLCTWCPKKMDHGDLMAIITISRVTTPDTKQPLKKGNVASSYEVA